jgi:hypothetical protein
MGGGGAAGTGVVGATGAAPQGYGRAGLAKRSAGATPAASAAPAATLATATVDEVATRSEEAESAAPRRTAATRADGDGAFAMPPSAPAKVVTAQAPAEDADRVAAAAAESGESAGSAAPDPADLLAEARAARGQGRLADALSLCRRALAPGPTGGLLFDLLAEAAELALSLSRDDEARGYLDRLERLPGGADRARAIRDR